MTPRTRRLVTGLALLVVSLYVGRWCVAFLSERWWAETMGAAPRAAVTRWQLLGLALDGIAVVVASCWFAVQALLVARVVATVSVRRNVGDLQVREALPARYLWIAGVCTGILLGLVTGAGARAWRGPVALAWQGVHYGVKDPILGEDLGVYVGQLPVWEVAHDFAVTLVLLGLAVTTLLYVSIGGIKRERRALNVHPDARRHLGGLLALFAVVIGVGYLIAPYQLAASADGSMGAMAAITRIRAAQVMAGVSVGVALLCLAWAARGRNSLLFAGWSVLLLGVVIEGIVIPVLGDQSSPPAVTSAEVRQLEGIGWGLHTSAINPGADTIPGPTAVWDESVLARWFESQGRTLLAATPAEVHAEHGPVPGWLIAVTSAADEQRLDLLSIAEGTIGSTGGPLFVRADRSSDSAQPIRSLADPRLRPDAKPWRFVPMGTTVGGPLRRLAIAWARQAGGILTDATSRAVDWHLDPAERAAAVMPMATWSPPTPALVDGRLLWVVQGLLPLRVAPQSTRRIWRGANVAGVVPAFVATLDAVSGTMQVYLDPSADSLARSWERFAPGIVAPAASMPEAIRADLPYPTAWLASQLSVLEGPAWGLGRRPGGIVADGPAQTPMVVWTTRTTSGRVAVFEDPTRQVISAVVTASRINGVAHLAIDRLEHVAIANGRELEREWSQDLTLSHLRDSAHAASDTFLVPPVRWRASALGLTAWQPLFTVPVKGAPSLLGLGGAVGERVVAMRFPSELTARLQGDGGAAGPLGPSDNQRLTSAQAWLRQADSALARHDLTAFGRAFEELRKALQRPAP